MQEAHGNDALVRKYLSEILLNYWHFCSFGEGNKGGVITFIRKDACPLMDRIVSEVPVPGRVLVTTIGGDKGTQTIVNMHIFPMSIMGTCLNRIWCMFVTSCMIGLVCVTIIPLPIRFFLLEI